MRLVSCEDRCHTLHFRMNLSVTLNTSISLYFMVVAACCGFLQVGQVICVGKMHGAKYTKIQGANLLEASKDLKTEHIQVQEWPSQTP